MNFHNAKPHEYEFQMVSMVDVIFTLLTFFVLGSEFRNLEKDFSLGYGRPLLSAGAKAEDFPKSIQFELRRRGDGVAISMGQLALGENNFDAIRDKLAEINMPSLEVQIAADGDLSIDQVARALDAALASPMKNVSVARLPGAKRAVRIESEHGPSLAARVD